MCSWRQLSGELRSADAPGFIDAAASPLTHGISVSSSQVLTHCIPSAVPGSCHVLGLLETTQNQTAHGSHLLGVRGLQETRPRRPGTLEPYLQMCLRRPTEGRGGRSLQLGWVVLPMFSFVAATVLTTTS